jgi:transcriptional regulator of met regulon
VIWNFAPAYSENTAKSRVYLKLEINMRIHSVFVLIDDRTRRIAPRLGAARAV